MQEEWKIIKEYEEYDISNHGRVRSRKSGEPVVLCQNTHRKGYKMLYLYKQGVRKKFFVHRLVAAMFLENPKEYPIVNHKDLDKAHNHVKNLEWCDESANQLHWREKYGIAKDDPDVPF